MNREVKFPCLSFLNISDPKLLVDKAEGEGPDPKSAVAIIQLEKQNERLKEALIRFVFGGLPYVKVIRDSL